MWNLKKGQNELLCKTDTDSQPLKTYGFQRRQFVGQMDALWVWDGNPIKLDCDDHCTTINVINSLSNNNKKRKNNRLLACAHYAMPSLNSLDKGVAEQGEGRWSEWCFSQFSPWIPASKSPTGLM